MACHNYLKKLNYCNQIKDTKKKKKKKKSQGKEFFNSKLLYYSKSMDLLLPKCYSQPQIYKPGVPISTFLLLNK